MKIFGLIGVLGTIAVIGWWFSQSMTVGTVNDPESTPTYSDVIDSAEEAVKKVEDRFSSGSSVEIYTGISYPTNARSVDVSNRNLSGSLKAEIRLLSALEELDMSHNQLTGVPAEIGQLSSLRTLNLSHNPITGLPLELGNLRNLTLLDLRGTQYAKQDLDTIKASLPATVTILVD